MGEERDNDGDPVGKTHLTWVVDPIDGTTCFVSDLPSWRVSIACVNERGHPVLGVIRDPTGEETFSALEGRATVNGLGVSVPTKGITDGLVGVGHPRNTPYELTISFLSGLFDMGGLFHNSGLAALALAYAAAGRLVGFHESDLRAWTRSRARYADEAPTIAQLHQFATDSDYQLRGKHHEIYPRAPCLTAPESSERQQGSPLGHVPSSRPSQEAAVLLCGPASVDDEHVTRDHGSRRRR
jgi:hypothetical protein